VSYKGTVRNGVVVLPPGVKLPEGAAVEVIPEEIKPEEDPFLAAALRVKKPRRHWPEDYSRNLDHYLYGARKNP
jgi:hypothetical protein